MQYAIPPQGTRQSLKYRLEGTKEGLTSWGRRLRPRDTIL